MERIELPNIPDLDVLFSKYDEAVNCPLDDVDRKSPYVAFLLDYKFLSVNEGVYAANPEINLQDKTRREDIFLRYIEDWQSVKHIEACLTEDGTSLDDLIEKVKDAASANDVRVILSWLERLDYVYQSDGKYYLNLSYQSLDDNEIKGGIYPLSNRKVVDIKEDKYSIYEYLRKIKQGKIELNPEFQRNLVWSNVQKSRFIESSILDIPIPPIYLKKDNDNRNIVIDGLQRTSALLDFFDNKLTLEGLEALNELNGLSLNDIENDESLEYIRSKIEDKQLYFYILQPSVPMDIVYDIFNRINTGGTKLERQEIRNCVFIGKATVLLKKIAQTDIFKTAIDYGISGKRMKDREAILRCIAFMILPMAQYRNSMDEFLENAMRRINKMSEAEVEKLEKTVLQTFARTFSIFGKYNFRIPTDSTRGRINIAVMESVFHCFLGLEQNIVSKSELHGAYRELIENEDYLSAVRASTGSRNNVSTRFKLSHEYFDRFVKK